MSVTRLTYIDTLRGLGIILVVLSHSVCPSLMYWANGFFMPLFYILSGFLDNTNYQRCLFNDFLEKKTKRLLIPYVFWCVVILLLTNNIKIQDLIGVVYSRASLFKGGFDDYILFLNYYIRPLWFLTSMFTSFLLYYIIMKFDGRSRRNILFLFVIISIVIKYLPILLPWSLDTSLMGAVFIFAGKKCRDHGLLEYKNVCWLFIPVFSYVLFHFINGVENMSMSSFGRFAPFALVCGICGTYSLTFMVKKLNSVFLDSVIWGGRKDTFMDREKYFSYILYSFANIKSSRRFFVE